MNTPYYRVVAAPDDGHARADRKAIHFFCLKLHREPVSALAYLISKQPNRAVIVRNDDINSAVVVDVTERGGTADLRYLEHRTGFGRHMAKLPTAALVVIVEPLGAKTRVAECRFQQSEISGGVIELSMSIAAKNGDALAGEIGHQQHQAAVIFNIRERDSHAGFCQPIHAVSDAHVQRRFPECTVSLIKPEEIGGGVVGDVDIGEAVAVEVRT